ncbi:MAG: signal peptidase I [Sedimentisphaerales bacterium]|nr:signal peptidase I [Sedimentisphaerales bacterium]
MAVSKNEKTGSNKAHQSKRDRASEVANTFEWIITAFILAFVFRAFVMEAFRIPTGSMADTLKGAHFRLCCSQCGYKYGHGFSPRNYEQCLYCGRIFRIDSKNNQRCPYCRYDLVRLPEDTVPSGNVELPPTRCPSCGYEQDDDRFTDNYMPVANGDRILVLKCIYQLFEPKRWDVIVFRNPLNPSENYIKRLIGLPGDKIEIIDGDVYINDLIQHKPAKVQNELWTPIYDNDYQPVRPKEGLFNHHSWQQPFVNDTGSNWILDEPNCPALFSLDCPADQINTMVYSTTTGNNFRAAYAYDDVAKYVSIPYCSDLMVRFYARSEKPSGRVGIALSKYETDYKAWIDLTGEMVIAKITQGNETLLAKKSVTPLLINKPALIKFSNVDHQLIFQVGGEQLTYDLGRGRDAAGKVEQGIEPQVKIFGSGQLTLSHATIFRDIHYTETDAPNWAAEGNSMTLGKDEFFVLGDNSPDSADGRLWEQKGIGIKGQRIYREGIVPRNYLAGKALFVYWPSGFEFPWPKGVKTFLSENCRHNRLAAIGNWLACLRWIPNIGQLRFIYGGSSKNP